MPESDVSERYMPNGWTVPALTEENSQFFTSGKLLVQRCAECKHVQHPPEEVCRNCHAMAFDYVEARPYGVLESWTIVHHAVHPLLKAMVPYNVVVVALEEYPDVRIVGNVVDASAAQLHTGLRLRATWAEVPAGESSEENLRLPQWRVAP